jgi:hypothetical protein
MLKTLKAQTAAGPVIDHAWSHLIAHRSEEYLPKLLLPHVLDGVRGSSKATLGRMLRSVRVGTEADRAGWATIHAQSTGGSFAQVRLLQLDFPTAIPFTDPDVVDFALSLPIDQRIDRSAYVRMICQEFPSLARVPRAGGGLPLLHTRLEAAVHWRTLDFYRRGLPRLTGGLFRAHDHGNYVHLNEWFRGWNREFIGLTLTDHPMLADHFDMTALNSFVRSYLDGRNGQGTMAEVIASLLTFTLFRERLALLPTVSLDGP